MNEEAPDSKEVAHFHFNQLRTLKITKGNEEVPRGSLNVIAPASKYGLLFVGVSNGFKVLKLENILDLDEDKENKSLEENYYCQVVNSESPVLLSLSADQKTLAVCVKRNANVFADMYDIAAFADPEEKPEPFQNVLLSGNNSKLRDFLWNPVADGTYAYCMSDGSLSVHELTGMKLTIIATVPNANATAACWSPKGKQIVIGKKDGSLGQYKPTLQEVKSIPPPGGENYSVTNICWVSTAQFAVLYVPEGQNVSPCLFIVSTPKNAPIVYMNFFDICLGNARSDDQRYFLHHESAWGVLVCASTDSIEVAVLGDSPSWVQWEVRDDCRALLPAKHGAKNAAAMGVMYCSQRSILISETEIYPPMPIIFYLTDNGLLVSYHLVNSAPGSVSLVRPSTPIDRENERKRPGVGQSQSGLATSNPLTFASPTSSSAFPSAISTPSFQSPPPVSAGVPSIQSGTSPSFGFGQNMSFPKIEPQQPAFGGSFQNVAPPKAGASLFRTPPAPAPPLENERFHKTSKGMSVGPSTPSVNKEASAVRQVAVAQRSIVGSKAEFEKESQIADTDAHLKSSQSQVPPVDSNLAHKENASNQYAYCAAIFEEMQTFEKELSDLKKSSEHSVIGSPEEKTRLMQCTLQFQDFQSKMSETMLSLNSDVHSLRNLLLESFERVEEANSKEKRKNDHSYISMLKDRALDPMTARQMQTIDQRRMYVSTQLQELSNKIDLDWVEYLEKKKEKYKSTRHLSSAEAIYKTIQSNQNSIHNLRNAVATLSKKAADKRLENLYRKRNKSQFIKRSDSEELSKLADAFLQTKIASTEEEKPQLQKKMSSGAQNVLKKYLSSCPVLSVRPTIIYSPSQSRFLSKSLLYDPHQDSNKTQASVPTNDQPAPVQAKLDKSSPNLKPISVMKPVITNQPPMLISSNTLETFSSENKTPISKPRVTSASEFEKLRLQNRTPTSSENKSSDPFKGTMNNSAPKFTATTLSFVPPKPAVSVLSPAEIESPIYEDITPPDSPDLSKYTQIVPETKIIQVSFNQNIAEVQRGSPPNIFEKKSLTSEKLDKFPNLHDIKHQLPTTRVFQPPSNPPESTPPPFSMPMSAKLLTTDSTPKSESSLSEKSKTPESSFNPLSKPVFGKPATTSTFSFFTPTSSMSFPNFASGSSFFSTPAKKEESSAVKPPQPTAGAKASDPPPTTTSFSSPTLGSEQTKPASGGSFFSKSIFSGVEKQVEGFGFVQPPTPSAPASTTVTETSSFFSKTPAVTKEFTFFQPTSVASSFSFASEPSKGASTEATSPQPLKPDAEVVPKTTEKVQTTESHPGATFPPLAQTAFEPAPINLSQKTEVSVASTDTPGGTTTAVQSPSTQDAVSVVKPAGLVFNQSAFGAPVTSASVTPTVTETSVFGQSTFGAPVTSASVTPTVTETSVFGQSTFGAPVTSASVTPTVTETSVFGQTATPSQPSFFGSAATFGQTTAFSGPVTGGTSSFFDPSATTNSSFFGKTADAPVFGQASTFGSAVTTTASGTFPQAAGTFFSQPSGGQTSVFGGSTATPGNSAFNTQPAAAKSPFGQTQGSFGLAKSVFGQQSTTTAPVFGQPASPASNSTPFGQTTGNTTFGQGSFFSGLGGKPSTENASKNVFAVGNLITQPSETSVFGATAFGAKTGGSFTGGSFSSGGGSVAQAGFGAFQQQTTPQKTGGFGAAPSFGSPPAFGSAPTFGGGCTLGSVFGSTQQQQQPAQNANFSSFASASSPTFGSLASQSPGGFGSAQPQTFGQSSPFGAAPVFGSAPAFGGQQPSSFGSPSAASSGSSSAFTQWRN